jgi:hypothetical protein
MNTSYKIMLRLARITLIVCIIVCLTLYISYKQTIERKEPIEYSLVNQTESYWRGTNYKMYIVYNRKKYLVSISRKMSDSIDVGKMPKLYYNEFTTSIVNNYHKSTALKVLSVLFILFSLSFFIKAKK